MFSVCNRRATKAPHQSFDGKLDPRLLETDPAVPPDTQVSKLWCRFTKTLRRRMKQKKDLESTWQLPQGLQDAEELLEVGAKQWAGKGSGGSSPPGIPPKDPPEISHKDPCSGSCTLSGDGRNHPHVQSYLCSYSWWPKFCLWSRHPWVRLVTIPASAISRLPHPAWSHRHACWWASTHPIPGTPGDSTWGKSRITRTARSQGFLQGSREERLGK